MFFPRAQLTTATGLALVAVETKPCRCLIRVRDQLALVGVKLTERVGPIRDGGSTSRCVQVASRLLCRLTRHPCELVPGRFGVHASWLPVGNLARTMRLWIPTRSHRST